jgi:Tfp pilus assembly ATPase PilU
MSENGEIPFLDADLLREDDIVSEQLSLIVEHGNNEDDAAINNIISKLKKNKKYQSKSPDQIHDLAINLYNLGCQQIIKQQADQQQIKAIAELFGEDQQQLLERLN